MSRLYIEGFSDMSKTALTSRANELAVVKILWGDKYNPKLAARLVIVWKKGMDKPEVVLQHDGITPKTTEI